MFYDNIFKIESSEKTNKIPEDICTLFSKAGKIYEEARELSCDNNFSEIEIKRRKDNSDAIKNIIYDALHKITDMEILTQLYNFLERHNQFWCSDFVLNVFCFNMAEQKIWDVIAKGIADNKTTEQVAMELLPFRMPYYGNGRYLVENYDRHIGTHTDSAVNIVERPSYTQLTFDFF